MKAFKSRINTRDLAKAVVNLILKGGLDLVSLSEHFYIISQSLNSLLFDLKLMLKKKKIVNLEDSFALIFSLVNTIRLLPNFMIFQLHLQNNRSFQNYIMLLIPVLRLITERSLILDFLEIFSIFSGPNTVLSATILEEIFRFKSSFGLSLKNIEGKLLIRPLLKKCPLFDFVKKLKAEEIIEFIDLFVCELVNTKIDSQYLSSLKNKLVSCLVADRKNLLLSLKHIIRDLVVANKTDHNSLRSIWKAARIVEYLYSSDSEPTTTFKVLDYILSEIDCRDAFFETVFLLNIKNNFEDKYQLKLAAFGVTYRIEYLGVMISKMDREDMSSNLPFNYPFIKEISRAFFKNFYVQLQKINYEKISVLSENIIVVALKKLYFLDSLIEFSANRDKFWSNNTLVMSIKKLDEKFQWEAMKTIPFIFRFEYRLSILNAYKRILLSSFTYSETNEITVKRGFLFDDTFQLYCDKQLNPFANWRVHLVDKFGFNEEGIDAGGLFKEYLYKLSEDAFNPESKIFIENTNGYLMPNPDSHLVSSVHLKIFEFLGFIVGVALLNDIKIYPNFSLFFLNNVLETENGLSELKTVDAELAKNLITLMEYEGDVENDFSLNFSITEERQDGVKTVDLIENGFSVSVTNANRHLYVKKLCEYKLLHRILKQCEEFKAGVSKVYDKSNLALFTSDELRQIIGGFNKRMNVADWMDNTSYKGFDLNVKEDINTITMFWEIVAGMDDKELEKLLFFATSLRQPPLSVNL